MKFKRMLGQRNLFVFALKALQAIKNKVPIGTTVPKGVE
jgi:hypothetical protein